MRPAHFVTCLLMVILAACRHASEPAPDGMAAYERLAQDHTALFPLPLTGPTKITSDFGRRRGVRGAAGSVHNGIDLAAPRGTSIHAPAGGRVRDVGHDRRGYGTYVSVAHPDGYVTLYAHLKAASVAAGDVVQRGEVIGQVGMSGNATGPHLHLEVRQHGMLLDPKTTFDLKGLEHQPVFAALF
ncbi:MAG: M23 family metallopeptidase [Alphaproteobacteria bacterium]